MRCASRYEPDINRTNEDLAAHYGTTVLPTRRPGRPRTGEGGKRRPKRRAVGSGAGAQPPVLLALRGPRGGQAPAGSARRAAVPEAKGGRRSLFEALDRPALKPLPAESGRKIYFGTPHRPLEYLEEAKAAGRNRRHPDGQEPVLRLMRAHGLLATVWRGHPCGDRTHSGRIRTENPDEL